MFEAINGMLLDMLAAVARKDYDDRRRRQAQGQAKAKAEGKYKGRPEDTERNAGIASLLAEGRSWSFIQDMTGCSRATVAKIAKRAATADETNAASSSTRPSLAAAASRSDARGRPSQYFYWDDIPARRLRPETLDRETALEQAKAVARAAEAA